MQEAPDKWEGLWDADGTALELRFAIDGVQYGNDGIASGGVGVVHYLYETYGVGNACAGKLSVRLLDPQPIARGIRECTLECRLVSSDGRERSGWLAQGTWFLNSVEHAADGSARLELFDGLALCDQYLYDKGAVPKSESYPKPASAVVDAICDKAGIEKPSDYSGFSSVQVPKPEGMTCREVLRSIAAVAGGNWTMAKDGRLRFVPLLGLGDDASFEMTVSDYRRASDERAVTGLSLVGYDDEYRYGSDAFEVSGECAWADGTVGNAAYYKVRGLKYQGFSATGCFVSPLAELGDQAAIAGTADAMLCDDFKLTYGQGMWGTVSSPLQDEVEQRIRYRTAADRRADRLASQLGSATGELDHMSTAEYVSELLGRMNAQANAAGGYTYITEGQGIRTYDREVSDPLVGAEATAVTEVKGGTVRIADSRDADGEWKWLTVFESGHIAAELVTAVNIVAGFIGSPSGNYWNLDTGELRMANATMVDDSGDEFNVAELASRTGDVARERAAEVVEALTVGGTNLLTGTNRLKSVASSPSWESLTWGGASPGTGARTVVDVSGAPCNAVKRGFRIAGGKGNSDVQQPGVPLTPGEDYVLSCYAKASTAGQRLYMAVGNGDTWKASSKQADTSWKRYYLKFKGDIDGADVTDGKTTVVLGNHGTRSGNLVICGMKLERGTKATDWSENPYDGEQRAVDAATDALNKANTYTNAVSEADREYTAAQRKALDESMNQAKIFNRLTNGGKKQGIYLKNGLVYVNGSYVKTGTLDAGIIKAGILSDKKGRNKWNMATGYLATKNMTAANANITGQISAGPAKGTHLTLQDGRLDGYHIDSKGRTRVGYVAPTAKIWLKDKKRYAYGMQLQSAGILRISSPLIGVLDSANVSKTTTTAFTGSIWLNNVTFGMSSNMKSCHTGKVELRFINGLFIGVGQYTTGLVTIRKR